MRLFRYLVVVALSLCAVGCSDDDVQKAELTVPSEDATIVESGATVVAMKVVSNTSWVLEADQNWVIINPSYGKGNADVNIGVTANTGTSSRKFKVTLKSGTIVQSVEFEQQGAIQKPVEPGVAKSWAKRLEVPELKAGNILHPVVTYESAVNDSVLTYIYEWDPNKLHIRWTAFYFDSFTCQKNWTRKDWKTGYTIDGVYYDDDPWHDDMYLAESMRTNYADNHKNNGYDRGHMVASGDRLYSMRANYETYSYSNMSPQLADFNQKYWVLLEGLVQDWGASRTFCDTLYVCKGATIDNEDDILKIVKQLPVPKYYYMALMKIKNGKYSAAGFLMEHKTEGYSQSMSLKPFAMSIDALEEKTGVNFFHNLPDDIEADIETTYTESDWF